MSNKETIDKLVRDITKIGSISKSEAKRRLNSIIKTELANQEEEIPSGVSAWMNYGKKYGYDKFFYNKFVEEIVGEERYDKWLPEDSYNIGYNRCIKQMKAKALIYINK